MTVSRVAHRHGNLFNHLTVPGVALWKRVHTTRRCPPQKPQPPQIKLPACTSLGVIRRDLGHFFLRKNQMTSSAQQRGQISGLEVTLDAEYFLRRVTFRAAFELEIRVCVIIGQYEVLVDRRVCWYQGPYLPFRLNHHQHDPFRS
jgi:hypothetical protein